MKTLTLFMAALFGLSVNYSIAQTTNWTGTNSSSWTSSLNWDNGTPNSTKNAVIGTVGNGRYPIITTNGTAKNVTFNGDGKVTIANPTSKLNVYGDFTNNANLGAALITGEGGIVIMQRGSNSSTATITGDTDFKRLEMKGTSASNQVTIASGTTVQIKEWVKINSPGDLATNDGLVLLSKWNVDDEYCEGAAYVYIDDPDDDGTISGDVLVQRCIFEDYKTYHHLSSPIQYNATTNTIGNQMDDDFNPSDYATNPGHYGSYSFQTPFPYPPDLFYYDETDYDQNPPYTSYPYSGYVWPDSRWGWTGITSSSYALTPGYGICARFNAIDHMLDFEGPVNDGSVYVDLSYTDNSAYEYTSVNDGWNLIGNPYPTPIDINYFYGTSDIGDVFSTWVNTGEEFQGTQQYYDISDQSFTAGWEDGIVAIGQGFWIQALDDVTIEFTDDFRYNDPYTIFWKTEAPKDRLGITVSSANRKDATLIKIDKNASREFMKGKDAGKMVNPEPAHNIFTNKGNSNLAINKLPADQYRTVIPLNIELGAIDNPKLEFSQYVKEDANLEYLLEDRDLGKMIAIEKGMVYSFATSKTTVQDRFFVHVINSAYTNESTNLLDFNAYMSDDELVLSIKEIDLENATITVTDMMGKVVFNSTRDLNIGNTRMHIGGLPTGIYLVNVRGNDFDSTEKIVVSKL